MYLHGKCNVVARTCKRSINFLVSLSETPKIECSAFARLMVTSIKCRHFCCMQPVY
jgi:hypothetical protein